MPNFSAPDDSDECGCTFGASCEYHAQRARESREAWEAQCAREGTDPNPDLSDPTLVRLVMEVETSLALSENQKRAIRRILFPRRH